MSHRSPFLRATRAALPAEGDERFADRAAAGRQLAGLLGRFRGGPALALAISPGGVVVAGELARSLRISLDALVAREFGAPGWPAAVGGAVSEGGGMCINGATLRLPGVTSDAVWRAAEQLQAEIAGLAARYRPGRALDLYPRCPVILVDDGLRSSLAQLAALRLLRHYHPHAIVAATPFGTASALACLEHHIDTVACLSVAPPAGDDPADHWAYPIEETEAADMLARLRGSL